MIGWIRGLFASTPERRLSVKFGVSELDAKACLDEARGRMGTAEAVDQAEAIEQRAARHIEKALQVGLTPRAWLERRRRHVFFPCGCSRLKVDAGMCDLYAPGESP